MQQRSVKPGSSHNPLVRGLSLISSIGMLSSGMVWAQTQTSPDAAIDPTAYDIPLTVEALPTLQAPVAPESAPTAPEQLTQVAPESAPTAAPELAAEQKKSARVVPEPTPAAAEPKPAPVWEEPTQVAPETAPTAAEPEGWAPESAASPTPLAAPAATLPKQGATAEAKLSVEKSNGGSHGEQPLLDYNNLYIDPASYSIGATNDYSEPSAVVLSERSSGCEIVVEQGQVVEGSTCGVESRSPETASLTQSPEIAETKAGAGYQAPDAQPSVQEVAEVQPIAQSQEVLPYPAPMPVQPSAQSQEVLLYPPRAPVQPIAQSPPLPVVYAPPMPVEPIAPSSSLPIVYAPPQPVQSYAYAEEVADADIQTRDVGPVSAIADGNSIVAPLPPPPGPAGFYYSSSIDRPIGLPGNGNLNLMFPLAIPAPITSAFGWRIHPISGISSFHSGTDLGAAMGTPVLAAYDGKVAIADFLGGYGLAIVLEHNNGSQETLYAHLSEVFVKPGDAIAQGSAIGRVGSTGNSTGPHLHFEFRQMTKEGWVTQDPGIQLESALAQLVKAMQTAQSTPKPKAG